MRIALLGLAFALGIAGCGIPAHAHAAGHATGLAPVTFRLQLSGQSAPGQTYWVSYGPLTGRWGVIRLLPARSGLYAGRAILPVTGRTTFAYLAAAGVTTTPTGTEPGNGVFTIRLLNRVTARQAANTVVRWHVPEG